MWRRWDLHIHTPDTKMSDGYKLPDETKWEEFVKRLENSSVQVFGITDYFSSKNYFKCMSVYKHHFPNTEKVFFPNIEFRLSEAINFDGDSPHLHIIFDNDTDFCPESKINTFLSKLTIHGTDEAGAQRVCTDLETTNDFESASVTLENVKLALKQTFGDSKPYILVFPAKNDGIRSTDINSPRKILISDEIDKSCDAFFGDSSSVDYFLSTGRYETGVSRKKPVFSGCDAHSYEELERLSGDVPGYEPTWIKANPTFRGLQQTLFEPKSRVFIGDIPSVLSRKRTEATKFITELKIQKDQNYDGRNGIWFNRVSIPLNPELTAIIGNKGSGKSALADIIGLLGDSKQSDHFSFLTNKQGSKKFKQAGYAENFIAELHWESSNNCKKYLNEEVDKSKPELVKYLPQNFFEQLTNEIEVSEFQKEIEEVVFSHVDITDRMGKSSFKELEEFKTLQSKSDVSVLKAQLRALNIEIIKLEKQASSIHRKELEEKLVLKRHELKSAKNSFPIKVEPPSSETEEQKAINDEINRATQISEEIREKGEATKNRLAELKNRLQSLTTLLNKITSLKTHISQEKQIVTNMMSELKLEYSIDKIIQNTIDFSQVSSSIKDTSSEIETLETHGNLKFNKDFEFSSLVGINELREAYEFVQEWIKNLKNTLSAPHKRYQTYVQKTKEIENLIASIQGDVENPVDGTINHLENQILYIDGELRQTIEEKVLQRRDLSQKVFEAKKNVLKFYDELKTSVELKLKDVCDPEFVVSINSSFILEDNFNHRFLNNINKNRLGPFRGNDEGLSALNNYLEKVDWNNFETVHTFAETVIADINNGGEINEQLNSQKEFFDFLFSLDYFEPKYELRLDNKNLNQLSPGEKGLLLLVFYLHLDKENIPLIIDQPEDNLDNDSIYKVLAKCIREAKKNRQVILVTHNPNLAVGADAEQVIYVQLDKAKDYEFFNHSGAIEEPVTNQHIVKVLEGSRPAFIQRRLAYQIQ